MTEAGEIRIDDAAGVRRILFHRPEKRNAFTGAMYQAAADAMTSAAEAPDVRCLLFEGSGGAFTAGNDLADFAAHPPTFVGTAPVFKFLHGLATFPKPMIAAVDGPAVGVGSTMLLHCDAVYASERAKFAFPFVDLALVPEAASSLLLAERVGAIRAHEWLLFGEPILAADAERAGLVTRLVPHDELSAYARGRAEALAKKPPEALRLTRELLRGPRRAETLAVMKREGEIFAERVTSAEARAQFAAFLQRKSAPKNDR